MMINVILIVVGMLILFGLHAISGIAIELAYGVTSYLRGRDTKRFETVSTVWAVTMCYLLDKYSQDERLLGLFRSDEEAKAEIESVVGYALVWSALKDNNGMPFAWLADNKIPGVITLSISKREVDGFFDKYELERIVEKAALKDGLFA